MVGLGLYSEGKAEMFADTLDIGCKRKAKVIVYSNFGLSHWVNYGAIY